jgi:predicted nucleotidyltransferase component of viral defense system
MTLSPRLDILPLPQRTLWPELSAVPRHFVLYGGTALALRLGHRVSVDFDFFASAPLDHALLESIPFVRQGVTIQYGPSERTVLVKRDEGEVKVSFFGALPFGRVGDPEPTNDGIIDVASLHDLGGTKIKVLLQRVEAKDYRDIAALLAHGVALQQILAAAMALFGNAFNPVLAQKALAYFVGGDLESLDAATRALLLREAVADLTVTPSPIVSTRLER